MMIIFGEGDRSRSYIVCNSLVLENDAIHVLALAPLTSISGAVDTMWLYDNVTSTLKMNSLEFIGRH